MTITTKHQAAPAIGTPVYQPVWYKDKAGSLLLSPHGIAFRTAEDKENNTIIVKIAWNDLGHILLSKNQAKADLKLVHIDGKTSYIIKFKSRDESINAKAGMKEHWRHTHFDESMQSFTTGDCSEKFNDSMTTDFFSTDIDKSTRSCSAPPKKARPSTKPAKVPISTNSCKPIDERPMPGEASPTRNASVSPKICTPVNESDCPTVEKLGEKNCGRNETDSEAEGDDRRWSLCAKLIILLAVVFEALILTAYFVSVGKAEDGRIFGKNCEGSRDMFATSSSDYYIHDACVASGVGDPALSFPEMMASIGCAVEVDPLGVQKKFEQAIPDIVNKGIAKFGIDRGRIVEYTDEEVQLSNNYNARIKGVTLSCVIVRGWTEDIMPAAYASHLIASTLDIPPRRTEPDAYDMSLLFEADVLELGGGGVFFIPKKHCFDLDDLNDKGIMTGGKDSVAFFNIFIPPLKTVALGSKNAAVSSYGNRVSWLPMKIAPGPHVELIRGSYLDPKPELIGTLEALRGNHCPGGMVEPPCYEFSSDSTMELTGLLAEDAALISSYVQIMNMNDVLLEWEAYRNESGAVGELNFSAVPLLFDRDIASWHKNSGFLLHSFVDPTMSESDYLGKLVTPLNEAAANCVHENSTSKTFPAGDSALVLAGAVNRRLAELKGVPSDGVIENWFIDVANWYRPAENGYYLWNEAYLKQRVEFDNQGNLLPGNLTKRQLGLTAKWFMANNFSIGDELHEMLFRHQDTSEDIYSRSASKAVVMDSKCGKAATNSDIFVLVLGMAATFCGGVNALLLSIHSMLHWICVRIRPHRNRRDSQAVSGCWKILPTYELGLTLLGAVVFVALYTPFIVQVVTEFEIYNFKTIGVDMAAQNSDDINMFNGRASLVTLVYTETQCLESRPFLLALILANGLFIGILVNLPHVHMTFIVLARYLRRLAGKEDIIPPGCTVYERMLRILNPFLVHPVDGDGDGDDSNTVLHDGNHEYVPLTGTTASKTKNEDRSNVV